MIAGAAAALSWTILSLDGLAQNAVLNERPRLVIVGSIASSPFIVCLVGATCEPATLGRRLGVRSDERRAYIATRTGWLPGRSFALMSILCIPMALFITWGTLVMGDRVDERGVTCRDSWRRVTRRFDEVAAIEIYTAVDAPVGIMQRPNLLVRFKDASEWLYDPRGNALPTPDEVADYIAVRSGGAASRLGVRPRR
jgi:hypothetical protein